MTFSFLELISFFNFDSINSNSLAFNVLIFVFISLILLFILFFWIIISFNNSLNFDILSFVEQPLIKLGWISSGNESIFTLWEYNSSIFFWAFSICFNLLFALFNCSSKLFFLKYSIAFEYSLYLSFTIFNNLSFNLLSFGTSKFSSSSSFWFSSNCCNSFLINSILLFILFFNSGISISFKLLSLFIILNNFSLYFNSLVINFLYSSIWIAPSSIKLFILL